MCIAQPCLSAAWSQMAWCGWLWLRLLSPPDHHMMNHIPALSKTTHAGRPTSFSAQLREVHVGETTVLFPCRAWRLILTSQVGALNSSTESRKSRKSTKEQRGGGRKLSCSPLLSGSLFFSLCDLCPWPGPIHVPQIAQLMPQ